MDVHVLGTLWGDPVRLRVADSGGVRALDLEGPVAWEVLDRRTCTGYWDNSWAPCPDQASVGGEGQCRACFQGRNPEAAGALDEPACVFEPVCGGDPTKCHCTFGVVPHAVYVAFYGRLPKVGLTMGGRVATRLKEQGADAYFIAHEAANRGEARRMERRLSKVHGLPEWRTHKETLPQLARAVPWDAIEDVASDWRRRLESSGLRPGPVERIEHTLDQPLQGRPHRVRVVGRHRGTWIGAKGSHFFYEEAPRPGKLDVGHPSVAALKRGDLMGRWIRL